MPDENVELLDAVERLSSRIREMSEAEKFLGNDAIAPAYAAPIGTAHFDSAAQIFYINFGGGAAQWQAIGGATSITGTGVANQVTYWTGAQTVAGNAGFTYAAGGAVTITGAAGNQLVCGPAGNQVTLAVGATGAVTFNANGAGAAFTFSDETDVSTTSTAVAGTVTNFLSRIDFDPGAGFTTTVVGGSFRVEVGTAQARAGGTINCIFANVNVANGVAATNLFLRAAALTIDVEDATAGECITCRVSTALVDTGLADDVYGIRVVEGTVGAGTINTLWGIHIDDINSGGTNYAIQTNDGTVTFGDYVGILTISPATALELEETITLTANVADDYASCITFDPFYTGAWTVTRHNYMDIQDVATGGGAAVTDSAVFRFDANIGVHNALAAAFQTTDSNADTTNWAGGIKINVNGVLYKVPFVAV